MSSTSDHLQGTEIAIVGMSGRFPGARSIEEFWKNLAGGVESISFFSDEELLSEGISAEVTADPNYVGARGVLQEAEWFDASFFGFTPKQAEIMDPQQRIFLECAWEALESGGYDPERYDGSIGVYGGIGMSSYFTNNLVSRPDVINSVGAIEVLIANDKDHLATGISYRLNLTGPSMTVQTACSTSLVAIHVACQSLLHQECDMALAGGVSVLFPQNAGYVYQQGGVRSPDGHCRAFDARAEGMVGGSGAGIVLLKRLEDAERDEVRAIIRGSAINNDGSLKVGYTAPSVEGQSQVIAEAQAMAGADPETITYIEAHGTGTNLGDPVEIAALTQAFRFGTDRKNFCAIASLKSNIGHLDAAAGVAGLIKTVLALEEKSIPASLHFKEPNPEIDFDNSPFFVNHELAEWRAGSTPRRADVSSFGIGGTNAHAILEEAPQPPTAEASRPHQLLLLSAKTATALDTATTRFAERLRNRPDLVLADAAFTLQTGRKELSHRRMIVCRDQTSAIAALDKPDPSCVVSGVHEGSKRQVVFMFTGQGAQRPNMGVELYRTEQVFRQHLEECCDAFQAQTGLDLRPILYPPETHQDQAERQLSQTHITQPALFAFEYALAKLWMTWGIRPDAMIGHSIGEYVAACLAGVFSLEDAVTLVADRGRLMGQLPAGDMMAVPLPEADVRPLLGPGLSIATINGPQLCVVSGPTEAVDAVETVLTEQEVNTHRLNTSHAFHSAMMDPILGPYAERVKKVRRATPTIPFISNLTGRWISAEEATDPSYWTSQIRQTVQFSGGLDLLFAIPDRILLEVGPGATLSSLARGHSARPGELSVLSSLPHPKDPTPEVEHLLKTLGQLWLAGCQPNWSGFYAGETRRRTRLPTYPFERRRYWVSPTRTQATGSKIEHTDVTDWFFEPSWQRQTLNTGSPAESSPWLLFTDEDGIGSEMAKSLRSHGCDVICVSAHTHFSRIDGQRFTINPACREDYDHLIAELSVSAIFPAQIVHLWSVGKDSPYQPDPDLFARNQERGFYSLLYLVQALSDGQVNDPLHLTLVTSQVQDVNGQELLCPDKATVMGPAMTISEEFPNITCCSVDVSLTGPDDASIQAKNLLREATSKTTGSPVAYRGKYRWIQSFQTTQLTPLSGCPARLREAGTYLITGGLGGMGLALADYLAQMVNARLVLVARTGLPPKDSWEECLRCDDTPHSVVRQIRSLQAIEETGGEVLVCQADVSDKSQMERVLATAKERFGVLHGVIHAAGVPGGGLMLRQTMESVGDVFAAKITGSIVLHELIKDEKLDFMVFCSSKLSFYGAAGRVEYSAASKFMDVFARQASLDTDGFVTVINWDTWKEVGMAVQQKMEGAGKWQEIFPEFGLTNQDGVDAFSRILGHQIPQLAISLYGLQPNVPRSQVDSFSAPSTEEGQQATQATHPRPEMQTEYEPPRTETERVLAGIWQEVSGIEAVGIRDNFFELGGDSIIALQIVAKANQAGLKLTPRHVLEQQNIAELASVVGTTTRIEPEQGVVTGPVPLTPIQHWFFEKNLAEPHHFNQSVLLEELQPVDPSVFREAIRHVLEHHDALRLRYLREEAGWSQYIADPADKVRIDQMDLSSVSRVEQGAAIEAAAAEFQGSLDLVEGPLFRVAHLNLGPNRGGRWLIVIHHLAVDVVSWRFLLEDIQAAYQALKDQRGFSLPPKTLSFRQWSEHLSAYAQLPAVEQELHYWSSMGEKREASLPVDFPEGANTFGSIEEVSSSLTREETQVLLQQARAAYNTQVDELLLTATVQTFSTWTKQTSLMLEMEDHGREEFIEGIDVSRTLGWFTTNYPVTLQLEAGLAPGEAIKVIKDQLRTIPNNGMNCGVLRYLNEDPKLAQQLRRIPPAEVGVLYLGAVDQTDSRSTIFRKAKKSPGSGHSPESWRPHLLEITASVDSEQLTISMMFSHNVHQRNTAQALTQDLIQSLRSLIRHCQSPEAGGYTPSDFPLARIDQPGLDRLVRPGWQIEDLYPLSPMQQGLLFHAIHESERSVYCLTVGRIFHGNLDVIAWQKAWQSVVDRHPVLRSTFHWDGLDEPQQIVHRQVPLSWEQGDWRGFSETERKRRLDEFLQSAQERGFELEQPPLLRLSLFRLADEIHYFHSNFHHLLLDGPCVNLVVKEVVELYASYSRSEESRLERPRPYRDYIAWLQQQDLVQAEAFWREKLKDFEPPTPLRATIANNHSQGERDSFDHQEVNFSASDELAAFARQHQLTLSTLFQAAWALLLSQRGGKQDIVFGSVVSGHSGELDGMESMIGLFMNTLPMRTRVDPDSDLLDWLAEFQAQHTELREYAYTPLADIHVWRNVGPGTLLFESIVSFRTNPGQNSVRDGLEGLEIERVPSLNPSHYPLTVEGTFSEALWYRIVYDCSRFDSSTVSGMVVQLESYLSNFAAQADLRPTIVEFVALADQQLQIEQEKQLDDFSRRKLKRVTRRPLQSTRNESI